MIPNLHGHSYRVPLSEQPQIRPVATGVVPSPVIQQLAFRVASEMIRNMTGMAVELPRSIPLEISVGTDESSEISVSLLNQTFEESLASLSPVPAREGIFKELPPAVAKDDDQCSICCEGFPKRSLRSFVKLECDHLFHRKCIATWFEEHNKCPNCRHLMESRDPEWNEANRALIDKAQETLRKRKEETSGRQEKSIQTKRSRKHHH